MMDPGTAQEEPAAQSCRNVWAEPLKCSDQQNEQASKI